MSKFKGIITAIITPFTMDGSLFDLGTVNQIEYINKHGIQNVFACGSYGAFPVLERIERMRIAEIVVDECKRLAMKSIIHVGTTSTRASIYLAKHAQDIGADAISSVVPFYYSGTFYNEDIYLNYFHDLVNSVNIDVHCYNNPGTTGFNISPKFLEKLITIGVKGIKDGGSDMGRMKEMIDVVGKRNFDYYPSSTSSLITGFLLGADSCISGVSLACPELIMSIYNDMQSGAVKRATKTWKRVMEIRSILGSYGSRATAAYEVLKWRGVLVGKPRLPWIPLSEPQRNKIVADLIRTGVYGKLSR